jgi:hypothetical protein
MCNLYSITEGPQAIRDFARAMRESRGNLPPIPGVYPDYSAPIVRNAEDGQRELMMARGGMPSPFAITRGKNVILGSRTSAMRPLRIGDDGSALRAVASCPSRASPRMSFNPMTPGLQFGSLSTKAARSPPSQEFGRVGHRSGK